MPLDLKGTLLITGAAGGIGMGLVSQLLQSPYSTSYHSIYLHHPSAPGTLSSFLKSSAPLSHSYEIIPHDLSSLTAINTFTTSLNSRITSHDLPPIRGLFLIAGGVFLSRTSEQGINFTINGLETTFAVNYLSNFLLVSNLLQNMDPEGARIVYMSSTTHDPKWASNRYGSFKNHPILFESGGLKRLADGRKESVKRGEEWDAAMRRYGTSKLLMNMFMYELQRHLSSSLKFSRISILALDPGVVGGTNLYIHFPTYLYLILAYILIPIQLIMVHFFPNGRLRTAKKTGRDLLFACFDEEKLGRYPGGMYLNGTEVTDSSVESRDVGKQKELWSGSLEILRERGGLVEGSAFVRFRVE